LLTVASDWEELQLTTLRSANYYVAAVTVLSIPAETRHFTW